MNAQSEGLNSTREKEIGQHIGYRYDVNLVPDYQRITPFLAKYIEAMGWDDLNWLEDMRCSTAISTAGCRCPHRSPCRTISRTATWSPASFWSNSKCRTATRWWACAGHT